MKIIGLSGSLARPSRTSTLVESILDHAGRRLDARTGLVEIAALAPELGATVDPGRIPPALAAAFRLVATADVLVVGSPIYKASYTGLLKHFFDLLDPQALRGKTAILAATGGSEHHALALEHHLRPLLSFFGVVTVPVNIYARDGGFSRLPDGSGYRIDDPAIGERVRLAVDQLHAQFRRLPGKEAVAA